MYISEPPKLAAPSPMSSTIRAQQGLGASVTTSPSSHETSWISVNRANREPAVADEPCVRQISRDVECLRAACVQAGPLRRWWLRRRLRTLEKQKLRMEQHWRRSKHSRRTGKAVTPLGA